MLNAEEGDDAQEGAEPFPRMEEGRIKPDSDGDKGSTSGAQVRLRGDEERVCWTRRMRRASATAAREEKTVRRWVACIADPAVREHGGVLASRAGWLYCTRAVKDKTAREGKL